MKHSSSIVFSRLLMLENRPGPPTIKRANLPQPDTDQLHLPAERVNFEPASDIESSPISHSTGCIN